MLDCPQKTQKYMSKIARCRVFVDTCAFQAIWDAQDQFHAQAVDIWQRLLSSKLELITNSYILDETFTLMRSRQGIIAVDIFRKMLENPASRITIKRVTIEDEQDAWQWFMRDFNRLSFTDAVSFAMMFRLGITEVFTFDHHFEQAGFQHFV